MGNYIEETKSLEYRWFKSSIINKKEILSPINLYRGNYFETKLKQYQEGDRSQTKYIFNKDKKGYLTIKLSNMLFKRIPLNEMVKKTKVKSISQYKSTVIRYKRITKNPFVKLEENNNNYLNELRIFNYNEIFSNFNIENNNSFITKFTNHVTVMHRNLANILVKKLVPYLKKRHCLAIDIFSFDKMRQMLKIDFKECGISSIKKYYKYYLKYLTFNNFKESLLQMFIEEGDLFTLINQIITYKTLVKDMLFYLLCLIYLFDTESNNEEINRVYKRININDIEMFKEQTILINKKFMSTSKEAKIGANMEITFDKISHKNWFLYSKSFDVEGISIYACEREVIIQPNSIFEVIKVKKLEENLYYIHLHMKNNILNECSNINMSPSMKMNLGICNEICSNLIERYNNINALNNIVSLTVNNIQNLLLNKNNIVYMKNIRVLDLSNTSLNDSDFEELIPFLTQLKYIEYINLSLTNISQKSFCFLQKILPTFTYLKSLNLNQNNISDHGISFLTEGLSNIKKLQILSLKYTQFGADGLENLAQFLPKFENLLYLDLSSNAFSYENIKRLIINIRKLKKLTYLDLSDNHISSTGLMFLIDEVSPTIQYLNFSENNIDQEGLLESCGALKKRTNLISFNIYGNLNGPYALKELMYAFLDITNLQELNFGCNYLSDIDIVILAMGFGNIANLIDLNLRENYITDDGFNYIINNINVLKKLEKLDISWNVIEGKEIDKKELCKNLNNIQNFIYLNLEGNPLLENNGSKELLKLFNNEELDENWIFNNINGEFIKTTKYISNENFSETYISQSNISTEEILILNNNIDENSFINELKNLSKYELVKTLKISREKLSCEHIKEIVKNVPNLKYLNELDLRNNVLGNEEFILLSQIFKSSPILNNLEILILNENNIGPNGIETFALEIKKSNNIKILNLNWNVIGDQGVISLSQCCFDKLISLNLQDNKITKEGMKNFSENIKNFKSLQTLDFSWNNIGDDGLIYLSNNMIILENLSLLQLSQCSLTDLSMNCFSTVVEKMMKLNKLYLWNNKIEDNGASKLLKIFETHKNLNTLDLSINNISEDIKQKYRDFDYILKNKNIEI